MSPQGKKGKSQKILDKVKEQQDRDQIVNVDEEEIKLVIFTLHEDFFAFYTSNIKEILTLEKINFVPGSPEYILGISNVRGDIESVMNINGFLGFPPQPESKENRVIIATAQGIRSGILVGSVEDVLDVPKSTIKSPLSTLHDNIRPFVIGEMEYKDHNVTVLNVDHIFERIAVKE